MIPQISSLSDARVGYGGKASGLSKLISFEMPVPNGVALSPEFVSAISSDPTNQGHKNALSEGLNIVNGDKRKFAVRSSALSEDGTQNSFAGIYDTVLNVSAEPEQLALAVQKVFNGQASARASFYKADRNLKSGSHADLGIVIQEMVSPKIAGVAFSSAISTSGNSVMLIECVTGLGDKLVNGEVTPSRIEIPLKTDGSPDSKNSTLTGKPLDFTGVDALADMVSRTAKANKADVDVEWAIDEKGNPWLLQARPITQTVLVPAINEIHSVPASPGSAKGKSFVVESEKDFPSFPDGGILVAEVTDTNYVPIMRKASAVVTEEGGILSHAAIVSREMGIPCIVGYPDARRRFPTGTAMAVDGASGTINAEQTSANPTTVKGQDIDWGAAYLFENMMPIKVGKLTAIFDPLPNGLAVHLPEKVDAASDTALEIFSRRTFGTSPKRYQTDKYLWHSEWENFGKNPFFNEQVEAAKMVSNSLNGNQLVDYYESVVDGGKALVAKKTHLKDPASNFLVDEMLLSKHFLLTMLIPEGYALKAMYTNASPHLHATGQTFSELLSGRTNDLPRNSKLATIRKFSGAVSRLRNGIYERLLGLGIMRDDYFDDREDRAKAALSSMNILCTRQQDPVARFYDEIKQVPTLGAIIQLNGSGTTQKKTPPIVRPSRKIGAPKPM